MAASHRSRWLWAAGAVGASVLAVVLVRPWLLGPVVVPSPVVRVALVRTLVASGHVATLFRSEIGTLASGVVVRVPVREGQTVRAGDTLIVLDATETRALALQADGQVRQAEAQVRQLRELTLPAAQQALAQARASLLNVEQEVGRNLAAEGFDTQSSMDAARKNLALARADVRAAELTVFTNQRGGGNFTVVATQLAQARASLEAARTRVGYRVILAPRAGVLIARNIEVGDVAQVGVALMALSPSGAMSIEVQVDEKNLAQVAVGQAALVSADAYPAERFAATVSFINPGVDLLRASVKVQLAVTTPPAYLRQDMTVSVDIETARHPGVLVAAAADIHDGGTTAPWVLVVRDGRARRQAVATGMITGGRAEILGGLVAGDVLVPATAVAVSDGDRLRLATPATSAATP
ncbi:MAG: efflux RND transporter periplasmic adaptor subunit [Gemmatimonadaceae bacterium]|nr:efflux RND transporter periplasmic adaptor subunit [Gemmatimonadaceae bacterium]